MAKPVVRIALDKDALLKLIPEGELEAHIAFDNSVVNLLHETANRLVNKGVIERIEKNLDSVIQSTLHKGWKRESSSELVKQAVEEIATKLIRETYQQAVEDVALRINQLIATRFATVEKLITQMTTPEAIEGLMIKACAALVKGKI